MADALARIVDEEVRVTIFGYDLLEPLIDRAELAASSAEDDAEDAEAAKTSAIASASAASGSATAAAADATEAGTTHDAILSAIAGLPGGTLPVLVATRLLLAAIAAPTAGDAAILLESGRHGLFKFDSGNLSALLTVDTEQGVFVAPSSDTTGASGAWVRQIEGPWNPEWFGAQEDTGANTVNSGTAFLAAIALLKATAANDDLFYYKGSEALRVKARRYYLGSSTLDITHTLTIEGVSEALHGNSSRLVWADNTTAIRIQAQNTSGASTVDGATHYSGSGTVIRRLGIEGGVSGTEAGFTGAEGEYHGIHAKSNFVIEDVYINGFRGDGVYVHTSAGAGSPDEGNANSSHINRLRVTNVRDGLNIDGADANVITTLGVNGTYCRRWTINDSSFLGNTHLGAHSANSGLVPGVEPSVVSHSGNRYAVKDGQATWCQTHAPSGTTADNQGWIYISVGADAAWLNIPLWTNGMAVRAGGGYRTDSANARNLFEGCYTEGGQGPSQFVFPTRWGGGLHAAGVVGTATEISGEKIDSSQGTVRASRLTAKATVGPTVPLLTAHNTSAFGTSGSALLGFANNYEADGVTPAYAASIYAWPTTSSLATAAGTLTFATRTVGGGGAQTDILILSPTAITPGADNTMALGNGGRRLTQVFATTGTINTSDEREKVWNGQLTPTHLKAARRITAEIGLFQWKASVADKKKDGARVHVGVRAQRVWAIMAEEGLEAPLKKGKRPNAHHAFLAYDEWEDGNRFGIRLDQLSLFLLAAMEARLAAIELPIEATP